MIRSFGLLACLLVAQAAGAQGCSQCKDNLASTPPKTQTAYRHAILLLMGAGGGIFAASTLLMRRFR